ncbi:BREX-1 system adenine-specific DNA-methyltransferase PglX [Lysinibacillus fusiformis]|uniref:BREX-1 system adenine-specific DNA-methyltransferase PglX n=1 Tax=Lysinibacillus fusiformis TaxID=28031 RepID=UPI00380FFEAC
MSKIMNKTALKNFATWSRRKLIEQVQTKALLYGIDENNGLHIEEQFGQLLINGQTYPLSMKPAFTALQKQLEQKDYKQLLEEAAYTWFNRIIAIRYMEVHEYLPERVNVLSSSVGRVDPDILFEYDTMNLNIKIEEIRELVNAGNTEVAYRILFVAQCNALNRILPFMFEPIQDYTELLLPDFLLDAESVIKTLVQNEELTESFAEIEVIGWLYQYYIAEEKDRVFAQKSKYKKEEIPFATQLFTPKWIVQYMVQNSLGRYWTEAHREDEDLIDNWDYFIKHEEKDFHEKIAPYVNKELKVEDIKLLDPAMGSGHILVYAFEVFHEIYEKCGYPERDIPRLILENNLYGLDIDDRAYQLAAFAVVMKAAQYSRRFLRSVEREGIQLNLASIQETNHISDDVMAYIAQQEVGEQYNRVKNFFNQYNNAKTYGSLINITEREISFIEERFVQIENNPVEDLFYGEQHEIAKQVLPALIYQTKIMRNEYDVAVMNPPYMGSSNMSNELGDFLKKKYSNSKADLFAAFMEVNFYIKPFGFYAAINQQSWMYLSSYKKLREALLSNLKILNLLHLGPGAFEELKGEVVQVCTFVLRNLKPNNLDICTKFYRYVDIKDHRKKEESFLNRENEYLLNQETFMSLPGSPIIYWVENEYLNLLNSYKKIGEISISDGQTKTGNNDKYLKFWWEVDNDKIHEKWKVHVKGGGYRRWSGNVEYVIDWSPEARKHYREDRVARILPEYLWYKEGICWSMISTGNLKGFRYVKEGYTFNLAAPTLFFHNKEDLFICLGFLNTKVSEKLLRSINPTKVNVGDVQSLPFYFLEDDKKEIIKLVKKSIDISDVDWDSYESSLDFKTHPLIALKSEDNLIKTSEQNFKEKIIDNQAHLLDNEIKLNSIFNKTFGLTEQAYIPNNEVSLSNTDQNYAKNFLSYFIGCLFGRYSLQKEGVISKLDVVTDINSFFPINKGLIQLTESKYSEIDIFTKLQDFLGAAFSVEKVNENMNWIADELERKNNEDAETRIRRYFMEEFYVDHCKMYQNHPIYWLVDSGKQKGLRTLIYMHHYQPDTMATIRFEHLQEIQAKYQQEIADLENRLVNPNLSATDKKKLNAEKVAFEKKIEELREFDKRLAAIAAEEIEIDLDDGVKVNYEKFYRGGKGVLAKIK